MSHFPKLSKNTNEINGILLKEVMTCGSVSPDKTLDDYMMDVKNQRDQILKEHTQHMAESDE